MHEAQIYVCTHQMRKINCSTNIEQHKCLDTMVFFPVYYCHSNLKNQEVKIINAVAMVTILLNKIKITVQVRKAQTLQ